jgi:hypothetical protein
VIGPAPASPKRTAEQDSVGEGSAASVAAGSLGRAQDGDGKGLLGDPARGGEGQGLAGEMDRGRVAGRSEVDGVAELS